MTDVLDPTAPPAPDDASTEPPLHAPRLAVVLGNVGRAMILAGIVVLMFVVFQLWGTDIQEARAQGDLRHDLEVRFDDAAVELAGFLARPAATTDTDATGTATTGTDATGTDESTASDEDGSTGAEAAVPVGADFPEPTPEQIDEALLALLFPEDGDALAKIEIPAIEVDKIVVRGVAVADLRKGPGHYSQTALPGNPGNAGIAGHRTTYGSPFNRIDELMPGDEITITSVQGEFVYRVMDPDIAYGAMTELVDAVGPGHIIVPPSATWVLDDFGDDRLTLTACHPKLSSRQRIIVTAELVNDSVELPDWAVEAQEQREAVAELGADSTTDTLGADEALDPEPDAVDTLDVSADAAADLPVDASTADLDEGLNGERDAIPPAAAWMLAAIVLWYTGGRLGRRFADGRFARLAFRFGGFVPAMICLWFSFELIDRALPAG